MSKNVSRPVLNRIKRRLTLTSYWNQDQALPYKRQYCILLLNMSPMELAKGSLLNMSLEIWTQSGKILFNYFLKKYMHYLKEFKKVDLPFYTDFVSKK